ncbi:hypothetical protein BURK2_02729 [Burkholderiales bacterium]|nr:hypothetical protein BURK2_02729 [Burkholderiales bacterium]
MKRALLAGDLFRFSCKRCRHETLLAFDTLYHDPDRKLMVWLKYPDEQGISRVDPAADGLFELLGEDYTYRIVSSANELVEKVRIFDDGYDDVAIELLKGLVSSVQGIDLTSPLYYSKTKKRFLGGPQIVLIEPTSDDQGWIEREYSVKEHFSKVQQTLRNLPPQAGKSHDRWVRVDRSYVVDLLESSGSIQRRYRVLVKGLGGSIEEQFWDLTEEQVEQFADEDGTAYAMCHFEQGEPRYSLLRKSLWQNLDRVTEAMSDPGLSEEERRRILERYGAV